jgi:hypothetical protein
VLLLECTSHVIRQLTIVLHQQHAHIEICPSSV